MGGALEIGHNASFAKNTPHSKQMPILRRRCAFFDSKTFRYWEFTRRGAQFRRVVEMDTPVTPIKRVPPQKLFYGCAGYLLRRWRCFRVVPTPASVTATKLRRQNPAPQRPGLWAFNPGSGSASLLRRHAVTQLDRRRGATVGSNPGNTRVPQAAALHKSHPSYPIIGTYLY